MIKQVIIMSLQDKCFGPNLETIKDNMKIRLEDLNGKVNGLQNLKVQSDCLKSSNADVFVELTFENEEALKNADDLRAKASSNSLAAKANLVKDFNEMNNK